jgi:hypothetical protein
MKKILLFGCSLIASTTLLAQTNTFPATGKVGIGTTTPGAGIPYDTKLHIYGTGTGSAGRTDLRIENTSTTAGARVTAVNNSGNFITIASFGTAYSAGLADMQAVSATNSLILVSGSNNPSGGSGSISFRPGGYDPTSETVRFTAAGLVGIGTSTPTEKLSVNGNIRAKEIKVETANWPDYVFSKSYKSLSLPEMEKFIVLNNHLPEIPSADQVKSEGIAIGEMNSKLLKKIEELTLYMIDMDKKINRLENQNTKLRQTQGAKN